MRFLYGIVGSLLGFCCFLSSLYAQAPAAFRGEKQVIQPTPTDLAWNKRTQALFFNLHHHSARQIMFGHQDDLAYGVQWRNEEGRSDVKESCGSYPAVFGWDLSKLGQSHFNIDTVDFDNMRVMMQKAYKMGGINTISWHLDNPVSGGSAWDTTRAVGHILPGGSHYEVYRQKLDVLADYLKSVNHGFLFKKQIPILFRPFHEHTGHWFWWGEKHCTPAEYKILWRFTVTYLREVKGLRNLIIVYSPDIFKTKEQYLKCYPGDEWVDVLGLDDYHDVSSHGDPGELTNRLRMVVELAEERGKLAALTETGLETISHGTWWTDVLLKHIKEDPVASRIAYVLVWRNAWPHHHYAPYEGHHSAPNFVQFRNDPSMWFHDDLPNLYKYVPQDN